MRSRLTVDLNVWSAVFLTFVSFPAIILTDTWFDDECRDVSLGRQFDHTFAADNKLPLHRPSPNLWRVIRRFRY
jgi:hypothetical protein